MANSDTGFKNLRPYVLHVQILWHNPCLPYGRNIHIRLILGRLSESFWRSLRFAFCVGDPYAVFCVFFG